MKYPGPVHIVWSEPRLPYWEFRHEASSEHNLGFRVFFGPCFSCATVRGSDDFQNLEFFLERALKNSKNSTESNEVINRYLLKALALVYQQNKEQIKLDREALNVLKQLRDVEVKKTRELERLLSKR